MTASCPLHLATERYIRAAPPSATRRLGLWENPQTPLGWPKRWPMGGRRAMQGLVVLVVGALMAALLAALGPGQAIAQQEMRDLGKQGDFGLGLGASTFASGATLKYYVYDRHALQLLAGIFGFRGLNLTADYVQETDPLWKVESGHLRAGLGGGVTAVFYNDFGDDAWLGGVHGLGQMTWQFRTFPVELALELRPTVLFGDFVGGFYLGTGGAIRYYFDRD